MNTFVDRVKQLCLENDITVAQMLKDTNQGKNNMYKWSKLGSKPSYNTLKAMADYFNVSVDYLKCETDDRSQAPKVSIVNSINQSPNANLTINDNLSPQERELIDIYRSLSLSKQVALVTFLGSLKDDK